MTLTSIKPYFDQNGITIYLGDCREILPSIRAVDLAFTSPPYNCGMNYGELSDSMPIDDYFSFIETSIHAIASTIRSGGYLALNVPSWIGSRSDQVFAFDEYKAIASRHIPFEDLIIWAKSPPNGTAWGNFQTSPRIRANHEWVLIHRAPGGTNGKSDIDWKDWSRFTQSIWTINPTLPYRDVHPATFPIELANRIALLYSPNGGLVLDPFMGTGTTLDACRSLGRRAIGIEINERYCEIAAIRLEQGALFGAIGGVQ